MSVAINSLLNHSGAEAAAAEGWVQEQRRQFKEEQQQQHQRQIQNGGHQIQFRPPPPGEQERPKGHPQQYRYQQHSQHGQQIILPSPPSTAGGSGQPGTAAAPVPILSTSKNSVCGKCGEGFQCDSLRRKHEARHTKPYKCPLRSCQRSTTGFTSKNDLSRHMNSVHKGQAAVGYNCKYGNCRDKKKIYYRLDNFRNHLKKLHSPGGTGAVEAEFIKRAELECRTEDAGSSVDLSGAEASDATNMAAQSDAESVVGGRNTPARPVPQQSSTPLAISPERPRKNTYPASVFKQWNQEPPVPGPGPRPGSRDEPLQVDVAMTQDVQIPPSARIMDRAERKKQIREQIKELERLLQQLDEEDAREGRLVGMNNGVRSPSLGQSHPDTKFGIQNPRDDAIPHGVPSPRRAHLESKSLIHPDGSQSHPLPHHAGLQRHFQHSLEFDKDRNGAELSATSTMPSPPETVDSPQPGNWTRAGSHDALGNPRSPPLAPSPLMVQARRGTAPLPPRNNGIQKQGLIPQDVPPVAQLNREAGTRTFQCPQPGCKSKFHRECELRKHRRRHTRPYECTFSNCKSVFGSKNDWKRHENSQHHRLELWKCQIRPAEDATEVCGKVYFRKENFMNHLKSSAHGITEKRLQDDWASRCYLSGDGDDTFWCGFCIDPATGKKGVKIKLKNAGEGKKGPEGLDERYDHMAAHFENNLTMKSFVHPNNDIFTDDSSSVSDDDYSDPLLGMGSLSTNGTMVGQGGEREPISPLGLDQLADAASLKRGAGHSHYGDRDGLAHGQRKKQRVEGKSWYCCDPKREHTGFPHPNLVDVSLKCLDCHHERCPNCETGVPDTQALRMNAERESPKMMHQRSFSVDKKDIMTHHHTSQSSAGMNSMQVGYQR